jgi:DNA ligase 1
MIFMPQEEWKNLYRMRQIAAEDEKYIFIDPIQSRVMYRNLTKAGYLRITSFVRLNSVG